MAASRMTLKELAERIGIDRSQVHRLAYRDSVAQKEDRAIGGRLRAVVTVPLSWANKLIRRYETARKRAAPSAAQTTAP